MTEDEVAQAYRQYGFLVLRRCRRILRDEAAGEDALQEVFVRLMRYGRAFEKAESKVLWLYRVADRCCFDLLARRTSRAEAPLGESAQDLRPAGGGAQAIEDRDVVLRFLAHFDDRLKKVAVLHYLDEMTQEEIAEATGWSRQTIFKKLAVLRERATALRLRLWGGSEP